MRDLPCTETRQWQEVLIQPTARVLEFEPFSDTPFLASFDLLTNQPAATECQFGGGAIIRRPESIRSGSDTFCFLIAKTSGIYYEQTGRHLRLSRHEAILTRHDEPSRAGLKVLKVVVPRVEFEARGIYPDDAVMRRLSPQNEGLRLLRVYLRSLEMSGVDSAVEFGTSTAAQEIVQRHIFDFIALAVSWRGVVEESKFESVVDARLRAALGYIETHFDDPRLTIEMVARSQGISATYLRRLLKASGRSYLKVVNELRLQKVFTGLSAAGSDGRTILEVALAAGFSDISHFNRLFRARFGDTPSGVRGKHRSLR